MNENTKDMLRGRKVIVTGGAGFIGSHLCEGLVEVGADVIALDDLSAGKTVNVRHLESRNNFHFVQADVCDTGAAMDRLFDGCDTVFHNAASKKNICLDNPQRDLEVNAGGALNLLELARKHGVRKFVQASTGSVYGEPQIFPTKEDHPFEPVSYYGVSKLAGERYVDVFHKLYGLDTTILRYFHVYGPRQESNEFGGVVSIFLRRISEGKNPIVFGHGEQVRSFTYVKDLVEANLLAATAPAATGRAYNAASGIRVTINELAQGMLDILDPKRRLEVEHGEPLIGDIMEFDVANDRIREELGITFEQDFWGTLKKALADKEGFLNLPADHAAADGAAAALDMDWRSYLRHFAILLSGTAAAQAVNLVSYPLLTRLYTPADFGGFALFVAASAIPGAIACGRFDLAVPTAPHWGRRAIVWLCIVIGAGAGLLSALGAAAYWWWEGLPDAALMAPLLGLCVFLTGYTSTVQLYLMRHDRYRLSSTSLMVRTGTAVLAQVALAFVARDARSLTIGYSVGFLVQGLMLTAALRSVGIGRPNLRRMRALFRRYRRQVAIDIPSTFIAALSLNLMTFFLMTLFNQRTVGFYALANRIAITPLQLFNDALGQVFFQKAARSQESTGAFWNEMKFNVLVSGVLSIGVLGGIWLLARPFIGLYLGAEWIPAADMLLILAPMLAMRSLCMSVATAVFVLRRPQWLLWHNLANAAVQAIAFLAGRAAGFSVNDFLALAAVLLFCEYLVFALVLIVAARRGSAKAMPVPEQ